MWHRERNELREPVRPVPHRRVRRNRAPVVTDEDRVAVACERVGEAEDVQRDGRGLVVAVGSQARRRVATQPRCDDVIPRVRQARHQQVPRERVIGEAVHAERERTVGRTGLEVRDIDVVDGDVLWLIHAGEATQAAIRAIRPSEASREGATPTRIGETGAGAYEPSESRFDAMDEVVIRTEQLTKVYPGDILAVDHLDLEVHSGEIFGLLGPNGAGKTTTAGMLTTRVIPTSGTAMVGGVDVMAHPTRAKQVIGVVPQTNTLDRSLDVYENLYFHGRFFGMTAKTAKAEAHRLLEQFRLTDRARVPVLALSGGMAQRLMVARAIMHRPAILFLDEPTAGLDPQSRIALWEILGELHRDGQTILLTTHYMEEADQLCDRLAIIDHGRLLAADTPSALKQSVGVDAMVTITAVGDLDQLAAVLRSGVAAASKVEVGDGVVRLWSPGTAGILPQIIDVAEAAGFTVTDLSASAPTLETVFIQLTGKDLRE